MRRVLILLSLIASLGFVASPVATAQDDVDLGAIATTVQDADQGKLMTALETPPTDEQLPDGFSGATFIDAEALGAEAGEAPVDLLESSTGSIVYMLDYNPDPDAGTPDPLSMDFTIRIPTLGYQFFDKEVTSDDLDSLRDEMEANTSGGEGADFTIETIDVNGTEALLVTQEDDIEGTQSVVNIIILPVGNALVQAMIIEGGADLDAEATQDATQQLTLSGAAYLGEVAEKAR